MTTQAAVRNPLKKPQPGDAIEKAGVRVEVDSIENGEIYVCRIKDGDWQLYRFALARWAKQAAGATVVKVANA